MREFKKACCPNCMARIAPLCLRRGVRGEVVLGILCLVQPPDYHEPVIPMPLHLYILRRLVFMIPLLLGITVVSFLVATAVPADPLTANLGQRAMSDPTIVAAFKAEWG